LTVVVDEPPSDLSLGARPNLLPAAWRDALRDAPADDGPTPVRHPSPLPFVTLLARHTPYVNARAARLAQRDRDLQDDLQQEGRIALWRLDPVRVVSAERPDRYCRATIRFAMGRYLRT
jgi:hypothetical protein